MNLAISNVALCMFISVEVAFCASLKDADRIIVKRDVDIIPAIMGGAVDMTLDLLDKFGKGYGIRGSSKFDAFGLHDEKKFEDGAIDTTMPQERKKRSAVPCQGRNGTANGTTSNINTRSANNPDVETLARRKRSAQTNENPTNGSPPNGFQSNGTPPNGPPPDGPPPDGMPPNGCPPNGPPPNGPPPDGGPPDGMPRGPPPNCTQRPGEGHNGQSNAQIEGINDCLSGCNYNNCKLRTCFKEFPVSKRSKFV